tara:strand:- start:3655 stop:4599 length:945 start_codon:yes stop_codon:yes gene_type:complete
MKKTCKTSILFWVLIGVISLHTSCVDTKDSNPVTQHEKPLKDTEVKKTAQKLSNDFKSYWYSGEAEITSYQLDQARYGEMRQGKAVLIFVTENFLPHVQVKADNENPSNISVLKLNATKNFNTGIYPYSVMQSTFYPVANNQHALKVSSSVQEWCGHAYTQLNNKSDFEITSHSYFEGEADQKYTLEKTILENELWTQLRIDPKQLPIGDLQIIPSFEYTRFSHIDLKAYKALAVLAAASYTISYPDLNRTLVINFNPEFPYDITGWEETFKSGFGAKAKLLTTKASKLVSIKSPYWTKNHNMDEVLRTTLKLD